MAAPNIEMIAASLRSCSLEGGGGSGSGGGDHLPPRPQQLAEASDESAGGITVELNSETALPFHWEQRLDIRTGEIYYINWETGARTTDDPRTTAAAFSSTDYYYLDDDDDAASDGYSRTGTGDEDAYQGEEEEEDDDNTADSSSLSSASPMEDPDGSSGGGGGPILVAAGCKACFMYFMVPKRMDACPKCGCALLHLGRNGFF